MTAKSKPPETAQDPGRSRRALLIGGGVLLALIFLCCIVTAVILAVDPFGWNILGSLFGRADPLAGSMPPGTAYYVSVDLSALTDQKLARVVQPFLDASDSDEVVTLERLKEELDKAYFSQMDMTFQEDIEPWLGSHIALGVSSLDALGSMTGEQPGFLIALETRNNAEADQFLAGMADQMQTGSSGTSETSEYEGVTIYIQQPRYGSPTVFARSGEVVLISNSTDSLEDAIRAQKGDSLADDPGYSKSIASLPSGRLLSMYMDYGQIIDSYVDSYSSMMDALPESDMPFSSDIWQTDKFQELMEESMGQIEGMAMSLSIIDAGIRMDTVVVVQPDSDAAVTALRSETKPATEVIRMLPGETFFFIAGNTPNREWKAVRDQLIELGGISGTEYDEAMQEAANQIGINPETDLFPYLDGELAVALISSPEGFIADSANADLGILAIIETNNGSAMMDSIGKLGMVFDEADLPFERSQSGGMSYYLVSDPLTGKDVLAIGTDGDYLLAGTSAQDLLNLRSRKTSLASDPEYQKAVRSLPSGMQPMMYLDVQAMMDVIGSSMTGSSAASFDEATEALSPILSLIVGVDYRSSTVGRSTMVLVLAPPE
jgi:hypothetical protein